MRMIAIVLAALAATSSLYTPVRADGYEGSYKDPAPTRRYIYSHQPAARGCPRELRGLRAGECRRIMAEVEKRRVRARVVERVHYRRYREHDEPARGRCIRRVEAIGGQRPTERLARGAAWKEWRSMVRAMPGGGEAYMDDRYALKKRVECHIVGANGVMDRCTVSAVPCR